MDNLNQGTMPLTEFSEETSTRINNALEDRSIKTSKTETQRKKMQTGTSNNIGQF